MWLERGKLTVDSGNLTFSTAGTDKLQPGTYDIPFQKISNILAGPGTMISHDALRVLARQQTGLLAVGSDGVRLYAASMPFGPDRSELARRHALLWNDETTRVNIIRKMYAYRLGEELPAHMRDINTMRGIEGKRVKQVYQNLARQYGVDWEGRAYDRHDPESDDLINKAINHAVTAGYAAARIAVAVSGAIPQLGFIHETSGHSFALDIADLYRSSFMLPVAFQAASRLPPDQHDGIEAETRILAGKKLQQDNIIPDMIDHIKKLLEKDDSSGHAQSS